MDPMIPSRLGTDAFRKSWRHEDFDFHPILPTKPGEGDAAGMLLMLLTDRKQRPYPVHVPGEYAEASRSCPLNVTELSHHLNKRKNAGMPYGLPPLSDEQIRTVNRWVSSGAPGSYEQRGDISPEDRRSAERWTAYFRENGQTPYGLTVNRYIYEHLFLAHIYFSNESALKGNFYRLYRTRRSCDSYADGDEIITRRPWNLPRGYREEDVYYCFMKETETITHKNHIVYELNEKRMERWKKTVRTSGRS